MYTRVIPRDLFNESKLLKCLGQLSLMIHDGRATGLTVENTGESFVIDQRQCDGGLYCKSLIFKVRETILMLYSSYNSQSPFPLCLETEDFGEIEVFHDTGRLTDEFAEHIAVMAEQMLDIKYKCPDCGHEWEDQYTSACDADCDACGAKNIEALSYTETPT